MGVAAVYELTLQLENVPAPAGVSSLHCGEPDAPEIVYERVTLDAGEGDGGVLVNVTVGATLSTTQVYAVVLVTDAAFWAWIVSV